MKSSGSAAGPILGAGTAAAIAVIVAACSSGGSPSPTATTAPPASPTAAQASSPASSVSPTASGQAGLCGTAGLRVSKGTSSGTAGTIYYSIDFTNTSGALCVLAGFPGVSLVSAGSSAGSQIGADAKRISSSPVRSVAVAPGQTAHAVLGVAEAGNFPAAKCDPVTAHWLKVFPPGQTAAAYVRFTT
ncbi:MAG TPA: DUF4232 domain-containing protein, partial [Streptosporangiaceae bacterium]